MEELKKLKESLVFYPKWLLRLFSIGIYNKKFTIKRVTLTSQQIKIILLVLVNIIMMISYSLNNDKPTLLVWLGVFLFVIFMILIFVIIGLSIYKNYKIKQICKKYNITIEQWNNL